MIHSCSRGEEIEISSLFNYPKNKDGNLGNKTMCLATTKSVTLVVGSRKSHVHPRSRYGNRETNPNPEKVLCVYTSTVVIKS